MAQRYPTSRRTRRKYRIKWSRFLMIAVILALIITMVVLILRGCGGAEKKDPLPTMTPAAPTPTPAPTFRVPAPIADTQTSVLGVQQEYNVNGQDAQSYERAEPIAFGAGGEYTALEGVIAFRGNNYRDTTSFGQANVRDKKLAQVWNVRTGSLPKGTGSGSWSGVGWTGQPLLVRWPASTRAIMNINDEKKAKEGLIEAIYAAEDGKIYFIDVEDGEQTRKPIDAGISFKGSGCLDPRGYPLLYVGAGDWVPAHDGRDRQDPAVYIYSLIDQSLLYSFGSKDAFSQREFHAFDGNATIHAASDTLLQPGENGIFYSMKLNTQYNEAAGTISVSPSDVVKMRYTTKRIRDGESNNTYWRGMEDSPVYWNGYCYVADNAGTLLCIDINTMKVIWAQDVLDDTNGSPVFEIEDGEGYLYISTSLHWTADSDSSGNIPIWKINARTGEILWKKAYKCRTVSGVSGGVQSTGLLGKGSLQKMVYYTVARTPGNNSGLLVALDKATGEEAWTWPMDTYTWSSPVAVYGQDGAGYIITCDTAGKVFLLDGLTGELLDTLQLDESAIEATPAVFGDMLVVGSRFGGIYGVRIS